jgi:hypothetical protein
MELLLTPPAGPSLVLGVVGAAAVKRWTRIMGTVGVVEIVSQDGEIVNFKEE